MGENICVMHVLMCILKAGLHYQSFCDHSRNFASEYFIFWMICKKCLKWNLPLQNSIMHVITGTFIVDS
jgi:hypothetical protein